MKLRTRRASGTILPPSKRSKTRRQKDSGGTMARLKSRPGSQADILAPFLDLAENNADQLAAYMLHCGIERGTSSLQSEILAHYQTPAGYDVDMAARDLLRWPPIAARLRQLRGDIHKISAKT